MYTRGRVEEFIVHMYYSDVVNGGKREKKKIIVDRRERHRMSSATLSRPEEDIS